MSNQPKNTFDFVEVIGKNFWILLLIAFLVLAYLLSPILAPFLIAAVLAYICDPLVDRLCLIGIGKTKLSRGLATTFVLIGLIFAVITLFLIFIPLLQKQSVLISQRIPQLIDFFHLTIEPWLLSNFGVDLQIDHAEIREIIQNNWQGTKGLIATMLKAAGDKGMAFIGLLTNIVLIPIILFYMLRDWDDLVAYIQALVPRRWANKTTQVGQEVDTVLAEFLRGQLSVMLALCVFYSIGLRLAGLEMALSVGLIAGLLSFVPYAGFAIGFVLALILSLLQFGTFYEIIPVLVVFGIGQMVESYLLTPYLVGDRIGLHPAIVILALMAGGQLFGFVGVLIALPVTAAISVGLIHLKQFYLESDTFQG